MSNLSFCISASPQHLLYLPPSLGLCPSPGSLTPPLGSHSPFALGLQPLSLSHPLPLSLSSFIPPFSPPSLSFSLPSPPSLLGILQMSASSFWVSCPSYPDALIFLSFAVCPGVSGFGVHLSHSHLFSPIPLSPCLPHLCSPLLFFSLWVSMLCLCSSVFVFLSCLFSVPPCPGLCLSVCLCVFHSS